MDQPRNALLGASAGSGVSAPLNRLLVAGPLAPVAKTPRQMDESMSRNYETKLLPEQMPAFQAYVENLAVLQGRPVPDVLRDVHDYDLQGAFLSGLQPDDRGHLQDTYKKPNHPTFSDQSRYNGIDGNQGGVWDQVNGADRFRAGMTNVQNMGGANGLRQYFNQYEPGVRLVLPRGTR